MLKIRHLECFRWFGVLRFGVSEELTLGYRLGLQGLGAQQCSEVGLLAVSPVISCGNTRNWQKVRQLSALVPLKHKLLPSVVLDLESFNLEP